MNIVFVAGFLNSHLLELAESLNKVSNFHFIATENYLSAEGSDFGRRSLDAEYVVRYYDDLQKEYCRKLVKECDLAVFASNSAELLRIRMEKGGISFLCSERFFKKGRLRGLHPKHIRSIYKNVIQYSPRDDFHVLCASAYLPYDLTLYGFDVSKCYQWGYFPKVYRYDSIERIVEGKETHSILWCGRMLKLKHPELAVKAAKKLKDDGHSFQLTFVGDGPARAETEKLVHRLGLQENVIFAGAKTPEEVRRYMENSEVFLFTSDRKEGWGAVLNEAMNSACAVVASSAIGSVPFLIQNGENGFIYQNANANDLYRKIVSLFTRAEDTKRIQMNAYNTITETWSAKNAADNLIRLANALSEGKERPQFQGPCSSAGVLKDGWYKGAKRG